MAFKISSFHKTKTATDLYWPMETYNIAIFNSKYETNIYFAIIFSCKLYTFLYKLCSYTLAFKYHLQR